MKCLGGWNIPDLRLAMTVVVLAIAGGCETPSAHTFSRNYGLRGDVPADSPMEGPISEDDCVNGGQLFKMYCGSCHNARPLGERPLSNYHVAVAHMRSQAYLTGKEYRQIIMFLRRWHDTGPPTPDTEPSPKRFVYSQPISELRGQAPAANPGVPPPPGRGAFQQPGPERTQPAAKPAGDLPSPIE
jgi:hypothetical protein